MTDSTLCIGLLFGGRSGEHEVSIASARAIATALSQQPHYRVLPFYIQQDGVWCAPDQAAIVLQSGQPLPTVATEGLPPFRLPNEIDRVDVWFPVLHGPNGEDGTVQGLLQLMRKPYVGNGVLASSAGMDKIAMKALFAHAGLAQVKYVPLLRWQWQQDAAGWYEHIESELGYPCFVKPSNLGSSVGISKVRDRQQLAEAITSAMTYDARVIIEQGVTAREIECAVLGNDQPQVSGVGEITYKSDFYDYETKYTPGMADLLIPAPLPSAVVQAVQDMAVRAFQALGGAGLARVDFFYVESSATILINEINTLPGFTQTSMYPKLWEEAGIPFPDLCDRLIKLALAL